MTSWKRVRAEETMAILPVIHVLEATITKGTMMN